MDLKKKKLAEKMLLLLFALSDTKNAINLNTYKRYVYLYYLTSSFLNEDTESIDIIIDKGDIKIINFDSVLEEFKTREYISINNNDIIIERELKDSVGQLLSNKDGLIYPQFKEIQLFVNLLQSYSDQFIFTIFFSEPTFNSATLRGIKEVQSSESKLSDLLKQFKQKINNKMIDEYDVLSYWMEFILKHYYIGTGENSDK